jgi:hypothetical protein
MKVSLHIDRLVLEGLPLGSKDGPLVQAAVEMELSRLLSEGGLGNEMRSGGALPRLTADGVQVQHGDSPGTIGKKIAGSVYGGLRR